MYELIIIGGGPAGMTAAVYALRKQMSVVMISPDLGGQVLKPVYERLSGAVSYDELKILRLVYLSEQE